VFAPERLNVPEPVLLSEPAPEIISDEVPAPTDRVLVEAMETAPPLRVEIVALLRAVNEPPDIVVTVAAPVEVSEPAESVPTVEAPLTLTVPPEMELFNAPVTLTLPAEIPLVIVALLPKEVVPAPVRVVTVTVPLAPLKLTVPALLKVPTLWPAVPEMVAEPVASVVKLEPDLKSTALRVAPLTVTPDVPPRAPVEVVSVPALTVVAPE